MSGSAFSSERERRYWLLSLASVAAIYLSLGYMPQFAGFLREAGLLVPVFVVGMVLILAAVAAAAISAKLGGIEIAVILGIVAIYALALVRIELVEERTHLLEYGIVALFILEALSERAQNLGRPPLVPVLAVLLASAVGLVDELIQGTLPNRVFDWRDVGFNVLAAILAVGSVSIFRFVRARRQKTRHR